MRKRRVIGYQVRDLKTGEILKTWNAGKTGYGNAREWSKRRPGTQVEPIYSTMCWGV